MDLATRLTELQKRTLEHREVLLTEEAAKTALVMPFIQLLGYDVFNPSEVIPEFTADVATKKGEKVDYAICNGGKVSILIECKPSSAELNLSHAGQLFRYFSETDTRGSKSRAKPNKQSQTIQLSAESAKQLFDILKREFRL